MSSVTPRFPTTRISARELDELSTLVPESLEKDPWVIYHATSSARSADIESHGFVAGADTELLAAAQQTLCIFESIDWVGKDLGGYRVLKNFTAARLTRPDVYFSIHSKRSLVYASPDFAGGETMHAFRRAYRDLELFFANEEMRENEIQCRRSEAISLIRMGALPSRVVTPNLDWLSQQLKALRPFFDRFWRIRELHTHGVLYAVRIVPDDVPLLAFKYDSGFAYSGRMHAERIMHKVVLSDSEALERHVNSGGAFLAHAWREKNVDGLVRAIQQSAQGRPGQNQANTQTDTKRVIDDRAVAFDETDSLVKQYGGTDLVRAWATQRTVQPSQIP